MTRFWMPPQTAPLPNDLGIFLMQCPKNSLISAWPHSGVGAVGGGNYAEDR